MNGGCDDLCRKVRRLTNHLVFQDFTYRRWTKTPWTDKETEVWKVVPFHQKLGLRPERRHNFRFLIPIVGQRLFLVEIPVAQRLGA